MTLRNFAGCISGSNGPILVLFVANCSWINPDSFKAIKSIWTSCRFSPTLFPLKRIRVILQGRVLLQGGKKSTVCNIQLFNIILFINILILFLNLYIAYV